MPKRTEASFEGFLEWLVANCTNRRKTVCLGWKQEFYATYDGTVLRLDYGKKSHPGYLKEVHLRLVWSRFWRLKELWAVSKLYQKSIWEIDGVNLRLPPYVPALVRDYLAR